MPSDKGVWRHNRQDRPPLDQCRQSDEHNSRRIIRVARLHLALCAQRKLFSEEQILGCELRMRPAHL
jgi:hypothetical protein